MPHRGAREPASEAVAATGQALDLQDGQRRAARGQTETSIGRSDER